MINDKTCKFNDDQQGLTTGLSANAKQVDDVHMAPYLLHYLHFLVTEMIMNPIMVSMVMMTLTNAVMTTMTMMMMMTMMMTNHLNKVNHLAISVAFLQHLNCHSDRLSDNDKYDDDDNVT